MRQFVVGTTYAEVVLRGICAGSPLSVKVQADVVRFVNKQGSLLQASGASLELESFMQELNTDTWFVVDGALGRSHELHCRGAIFGPKSSRARHTFFLHQ